MDIFNKNKNFTINMCWIVYFMRFNLKSAPRPYKYRFLRHNKMSENLCEGNFQSYENDDYIDFTDYFNLVFNVNEKF